MKKRKPGQWELRDSVKRRTREWWWNGRRLMWLAAADIEGVDCEFAQVLPWGCFWRGKTGKI